MELGKERERLQAPDSKEEGWVVMMEAALGQGEGRGGRGSRRASQHWHGRAWKASLAEIWGQTASCMLTIACSC